MQVQTNRTILFVENDYLSINHDSDLFNNFYISFLSSSNELFDYLNSSKPDLIVLNTTDKSYEDLHELTRIISEKFDLPVILFIDSNSQHFDKNIFKLPNYGIFDKYSSVYQFKSIIEIAFELYHSRKSVEQSKSNSPNSLNNNLYLSILDSIPQAVFWKDTNLLYRGGNKKFLSDIGYKTYADLIGVDDNAMPWSEEERVKYIDDDNFVIKNKTHKLHIIESTTIDGHKTIYTDTSKVPLFNDQGDVTAILGIYDDITERLKMESELFKSEKIKNIILNGIKTNIAYLDTQMKIIWVNQTAATSAECTQEDMVGKYCYDFWAQGSNKPCIGCPVFKVVDSGKKEHGRLTDSKGRVWDVTAEPVFDDDNTLNGIVEIARDITNEISFEKILRENEERLTFVLDGSQLGYWDWNINTGKVYRNIRWAEMLGYTIEEIDQSVKQWTELHHPDDKKMAWLSITNHLEGKTDVYKIEYRMRTKDGNYKWILDQAKIVSRDETGKPIRMCGTHTDISEIKAVENEIKQLLKEKEHLLKEVNHRIKNNLSTIEGIMSLELAKVSNAEARSIISDTKSRVRSIAILYEKLYSGNNYNSYAIRDYVAKLIEEFKNIYPLINIVYEKNDIGNLRIDAKKLFSIGIIINEIVTNSVKYAFEGIDSPEISIKIKHINKSVDVFIRDNGNGIPDNFDYESNKGVGLYLARLLSQQIEAKFEIQNNNGTEVTLNFEL